MKTYADAFTAFKFSATKIAEYINREEVHPEVMRNKPRMALC